MPGRAPRCRIWSAARKGLAGLEYAGGIPGSLGGALIMNAGAYGNYTGQLVEEVVLVGPEGNVFRMGREELDFGYRRSNLAGAGIIIEARLKLEEGDPAELESKVEFFLAERRRRHPQLPSAGSVFRNLGLAAGCLIEAAGSKEWALRCTRFGTTRKFYC